MPTFIEEHTLDDAIGEDSSFSWRGKLIDEDGVTIPIASISAISGTLLDGDGAVVNGRNNQDILGTNGGSLSTVSSFTWFKMQFTADDAQTPGTLKWHKRIFNIHVIYNSGEFNHQVKFHVGNLTGV
jgi:hypothetical protein